MPARVEQPPNTALTGCFATSRESIGIMHPGPSAGEQHPGERHPGGNQPGQVRGRSGAGRRPLGVVWLSL